MNRTFILLGFFAAIAVTSCKDKEEAPETSGTVTLSSELKQIGSQFVVEAFSFEDAAKTDASAETVADLFLVEEFNVNEVSGGRFSSNLDNKEAFALVTSFPSLGTAEEFFEAYKTIEENIFSPLTPVLKSGQIYIYRSNKGNFAKFLVRDVTLMQQSEFVAVTLDWEYQPNGSRQFP